VSVIINALIFLIQQPTLLVAIYMDILELIIKIDTFSVSTKSLGIVELYQLLF
jgi:hypothetical protein